MKILDITPLVSENLAVWPGDTPYQRQVLMDIDKGDHLGLSKITTTLHLGAHADAPNHYAPQSAGIDERSLHPYLGPVQVVKANVPQGERITLDHLTDFKVQAPRLLFRTDSFLQPDVWCEDFCSLSPQLIESLAQQNVLTVGLDTPSIDPFSSRELESHKVVHKYNMAILEGLVLKDVEPGLYTLVALPLKLKGADASPVRAVLLPYQIFNGVAFSPSIS